MSHLEKYFIFTYKSNENYRNSFYVTLKLTNFAPQYLL
jgi:hypothetical protein